MFSNTNRQLRKLSIYKPTKMSYVQLLEKLQVCSKETLQQDVTVYDIVEDEFVPVSEANYTDKDSQVLDPSHLYLAF